MGEKTRKGKKKKGGEARNMQKKRKIEPKAEHQRVGKKLAGLTWRYW